MAESYKEYLAAQVLAEGKPVSYRLLSRALKVNVNTAKQMLYDFHTQQNAKKPKSVHATYILMGRATPPTSEHTNGTHTQDGEDSYMQSSPFASSMPEPEELAEKPVPVALTSLVREEELEKKKSEFAEITSIHMYSVENSPIENMNLLAVCNQEVEKKYSDDDPLERWKVYGCVHNPYIKRRTAKYVPPSSAKATVSAPTPLSRQSSGSVIKEEAEAPTSRRGSVSEDSKSERSTPKPSSSSKTVKKSDSKPNLKRNTSDIFKSFAKAKPKAKEPTPPPVEDEPMQGMSEDEGDADDTHEVEFNEEKAAAARKARADREARLKQMMEEDDDEPMEDASPTADDDSQDAPLDKEPPKAEGEATVSVQDGRRRGRRRVMKKKTVKDEDGYLVTKEEAVWESFSEAEPEPKKPKISKPTTAKGKKTGGGKYGQGSIASFFKKA